MKMKQWENALRVFTKALVHDPDNGEAIIGYSITNTSSLLSDPDIVNLMKNNLGFMDYPNSLEKILLPTKWMQLMDKKEIHKHNDQTWMNE